MIFIVTPFTYGKAKQKGHVWCRNGLLNTIRLNGKRVEKSGYAPYITALTRDFPQYTEKPSEDTRINSMRFFFFEPSFGSRVGTELSGKLSQYKDLVIPMHTQGPPGEFGIGLWTRYEKLMPHQSGHVIQMKPFIYESSFVKIATVPLPTPNWVQGINFPRSADGGVINVSINNSLDPDASELFRKFHEELKEKFYRCIKFNNIRLKKGIGNNNNDRRNSHGEDDQRA